MHSRRAQGRSGGFDRSRKALKMIIGATALERDSSGRYGCCAKSKRASNYERRFLRGTPWMPVDRELLLLRRLSHPRSCCRLDIVVENEVVSERRNGLAGDQNCEQASAELVRKIKACSRGRVRRHQLWNTRQ
jgi:hypothetical protein